MFNLSALLKNCIDKDKNINCKFSDCARFVRFVRYFLSGRIKKTYISDNIKKIIKNKIYYIYIKNTIRQITAGTLKSIDTINDINKQYFEQLG